MTNNFKQKHVNCYQWLIKVPSQFEKSHVTEFFKIQGHKCVLSLHSGYHSCNDTSIYFVGDEKLAFPVIVRLHVESNSNYLGRKRTLIVKKFQKIWNSVGSLLGESLIIEVSFGDYNCTSDDKSTQTPSYFDPSFGEDQFSTDLLKLLQDGSDYDFEFICDSQTINAHRNILSCRSSVFRSMLQSDMQEALTGQMNIKDINATVFKLFLTGLYTGSLPEVSVDTAIALYKASDKYDVNSMKEQCAEFLTDNLSLGNICEILVLADQHNDSHLKKKAMEYAFENKVPIVAENWTEFCEDHTILAVDILNSFCKDICEK